MIRCAFLEAHAEEEMFAEFVHDRPVQEKSQGVSPDMEFILTDSSGYALQDDERPDVSRKTLAAPRHNLRDTLESVYLSQKKEEALQIRWERGDCSRAQ